MTAYNGISEAGYNLQNKRHKMPGETAEIKYAGGNTPVNIEKK